jgi:lipopolysaccharide biosynthesis protein
MRFVAFYLPQFHPIAENDSWWGKGFTEWTNVSKAPTLFRGHYQPHLPADLGFYDLRLNEVREQQAELAGEYGIHGFCYYYYWFNGRKLLERPLDEMLRSKRPDFPFCICWANEPWSRNWDGSPTQVLMPQVHTPESDESFMREVLPILEDTRYIRVNGRPLLLIYRTEIFPNIAQTAEIWRETAFRRGMELYLCRVESFSSVTPSEIGFDAACEFPPNFLGLQPEVSPALEFCVPRGEPFSGRVYDYPKLVQLLTHRPETSYKRFCGATPSWDNTARSGARAAVFINSSPDLFRHLLSSAVRRTRSRFDGDEQIVFINAWNEWAEGAHLEPDRRYGHAFLEACKLALNAEVLAGMSDKPAAWQTFVPYTLL